MKKFLRELYKRLYGEDLVVTIEVIKEVPAPIPPKTKGEKLYDFCMTFYNTDPTPKDEQPDEYACVHSLTTILSKYYPGYPVMTYTPIFANYLATDRRFKMSTEFKKGNVIVSATNTGNGTIVGHTGIIGENGKILSNSSSTGLWFDKFDQASWIERYSRLGGLAIYIFEPVV
jgi:hypothetical protein